MVDNLQVEIFSDGADLSTMLEMANKPEIKGLTTNPTLMKKAGIKDYRVFAAEVLSKITTKPISFEVFSDELLEMNLQALEIASWGKNVNVKIPVTNSEGKSTTSLISQLSKQDVTLNVTAVMTVEQVAEITKAFADNSHGYISVFAGRIADTGIDPIPIMRQALEIMKKKPQLKLIWASPRELLNVVQADQIGCHIITATSEILAKLGLLGKDLNQYSLETVRMFRNDALSSGFSI